MSAPETILPQEAVRHPSALVLDVRTDIEHRALSLRHAHIHVPLDQLDAASFMQRHGLDASQQPLYILCRGGTRAAKAARLFHAAGLTDVRVIEGGILQCEACGVPLQAGRVISLERQVRIAVGGLILAGMALGGFASPWFYILPVMCGAGLLQAGLTEWCGMALLLSRAPWNKRQGNT